MPNCIIKSGNTEVAADSLAEVLGVVNDLQHYKLDASTLSVSMPRLDNGDVPLIRSSYGRIGVALEGDHEAALTSLLAPVLKTLVRDGRPPAPWEVPRKQWLGLVAIGSLAFNSIPGMDRTLARHNHSAPYKGTLKTDLGIEGWLDYTLLEHLGYAHNGPAYKPGSRETNSRHEVHVAYALSENKSVPQEAIDDMLGALKGGFDLSFARALAERPFLRGSIKVDQLQTLLNVYERDCKLKITEKNAPALLATAAHAGSGGPDSDPTWVEMDNALYRVGLIPALPALSPRVSAVAPDLPSGELAGALHQKLDAATMAGWLERLQSDWLQNQISVRTYEQQIVYHRDHPQQSSAAWANSVVAALESKDLPFLLRVMDHPDTQNAVSRRFARDNFAVNTLGLKAAGRTAAIFRYCDLDGTQQAAWETQAAAAKLAAQAQRDADDARESAVSRATQSTVRDESGAVTSWKEFIDRKVTEGFTAMTSMRSGAVMKHYLLNPSTRSIITMQRKDGSLDYAQLAVRDHAAAAQVNAVPEAAGEGEEEPQQARETQRG